DEAATHLGWSKSTLRRRLDEARAALGRRLRRRGVVWPAALWAVLVSDCAAQTLPPNLVGATVDAAFCLTSGAVTVAASARVAALAKGVINAMFLSKLKAAALLLALGITLALGVSSHTSAADDHDAPAPLAGDAKKHDGGPAPFPKPI